MSLPWVDGRCPVCERPNTATERTCPYCGWSMCAECLRRHMKPERHHLDHPMSTGKCRGRLDTR